MANKKTKSVKANVSETYNENFPSSGIPWKHPVVVALISIVGTIIVTIIFNSFGFVKNYGKFEEKIFNMKEKILDLESQIRETSKNIHGIDTRVSVLENKK